MIQQIIAYVKLLILRVKGNAAQTANLILSCWALMAEKEGSSSGWMAVVGIWDATGTVNALGNQSEKGPQCDLTAKIPSEYKTKPWARQQW